MPSSIRAKRQAAAPFISQAPKPYALSSLISSLNGSCAHPSPLGTVSKCTLNKYLGLPLVINKLSEPSPKSMIFRLTFSKEDR